MRSASSVGVHPRVMPTSTERICSRTMEVAKRRMDVLMIVSLSGRLARLKSMVRVWMELIVGGIIKEVSDDDVVVVVASVRLSLGVFMIASMLLLISGTIMESIDDDDDPPLSRVAA